MDDILDIVLWNHSKYLCGKMDRKNLINIMPSTMPYKDTVVQKGQTFIECKCVQVTNINRTELNHDKLYSIAMEVGKNPRYKSIDGLACTRIRKLCLNKWLKRGGKRLKHHIYRLGLIPEGADSSNVIHIKMDTRENLRDLKCNKTLSLLNAESIKNKKLVIYGQHIHHNVDLCILMETWPNKYVSDTTWLQCTVWNKDPYQMLT